MCDDWSQRPLLLSNGNRPQFTSGLGARGQTGDGPQSQRDERIRTMMNLKKKLQNPMALVVQGFVGGAIIFYATMPPETAGTQVQPQQGELTAVEKLVEA
jgi:hypothetical protein